MADSLLEEHQLVAASRTEDQFVLDLLIGHYHGRLFGFVLRGYRSTEDARDALQDTLLGKVRSIEEFREE